MLLGLFQQSLNGTLFLLEFRQVAIAKLGPFGRVMSVPLAQRIRGSYVFPPGIQFGGVFADSPGPEPVDQNARAIPCAYAFIYTLGLYLHLFIKSEGLTCVRYDSDTQDRLNFTEVWKRTVPLSNEKMSDSMQVLL